MIARLRIGWAASAPLLAAVLAPVLLGAVALGCGADNGDNGEEHSTSEEADLAAVIEAGLEYQRPPPLSYEEETYYGVTLHRRQVAGEMSDSTVAVMAPVALAAAIFAVEGPADLVLAVFPVHKLGKAVEIGRNAIKLRKKDKKARGLVKAMRRFTKELDADARGFLELAGKLSRAERRAVKQVSRRTGSVKVVESLVRKHVEGSADLVWIAKKLKQKKIDGDFAQRFTFDGDLVAELTLYPAHPSWRTLQNVVEGGPVEPGARAALMRKLKGLLGERAAADFVRSKAFARKYTKGSFTIRRGAGYGKHQSIDIVAASDRGEILFAEVKN